MSDPDPSGSEIKCFATCYNGTWVRCEPFEEQMGQSIRVHFVKFTTRIFINFTFYLKVSFIDFGQREIINISQMRHLPKKFQDVPKLALCCALGNIKPIGKNFSPESADDFVKLVEEKELYAKILRIETEVSVYNFSKFNS